jgi:hypothetical protein
MSKNHYNTSTYRDAVFLAECSADAAREWLRGQEVTYSSSQGIPKTPDERHILEYILLRRRDTLIDLSLAEFGRSSTVLLRVFSRSNKSTRVTICSNASLFLGESLTHKTDHIDLFWQLIAEGSPSELCAICENPNLSSGMYQAIMECWVGNESSSNKITQISNERFLKIVEALASNPRIQISRDNSREKYFLDGYADYQYNALFDECWKLALTAPLRQDWAEALTNLYTKLVIEYRPFDESKLWEVLERWTIDGEVRYSSYAELRGLLALRCLPPSLESLNHTDSAVRRAFYETFNPEKEEFKNLSWDSWRERDEFCEIHLIRNKSIWRSNSARRNLRSFLWKISNDDLTNVGWFDELEAEYRETNPDWFVSEDDEDTINPNQFDAIEANTALRDAIEAANDINGRGSINAHIQANNAVGRNVLDIDLGKFGIDGYNYYNLDQSKRDRLLAHTRQDAASAFRHAIDAFKQAREAKLEARKSNVLLVIITLLVLIPLLVQIF